MDTTLGTAAPTASGELAGSSLAEALLRELDRNRGLPDALASVTDEALAILRSKDILAPIAIFRVLDTSSVLDSTARSGHLFAEVPSLARAERLAFVVCGLGPAIDACVGAQFRARRFRLALALDTLANRALFRLNDRVWKRLRAEYAGAGANLGKPIAPGDGILPYAAQGAILDCAGARSAGFSLTSAGMIVPGRALDYVAPIGISTPPWNQRDRCRTCPSNVACRRAGH